MSVHAFPALFVCPDGEVADPFADDDAGEILVSCRAKAPVILFLWVLSSPESSRLADRETDRIISSLSAFGLRSCVLVCLSKQADPVGSLDHGMSFACIITCPAVCVCVRTAVDHTRSRDDSHSKRHSCYSPGGSFLSLACDSPADPPFAIIRPLDVPISLPPLILFSPCLCLRSFGG